MTAPSALSANAFIGSPTTPASPLDTRAEWWALRRRAVSRTFLAPPPRSSLADWREPDVGWGIVMREGVGDPPPAIQRLMKFRGSTKVFRYRPGWEHSVALLHEPAANRYVDVTGSDRGILPHYLLIVGSPSDVPWSLQYILNNNRSVGRLALDGVALDNYVSAVERGFDDAPANPYASVVWAVDHGAHDITHLMRNQIAAPVHAQYAADVDMAAAATFLDGTHDPQAGLGACFIETLASARPGMVVSTSHGHTAPLADPAAMAAQLGVPVDQAHAVLDVDTLFQQWEPSGAIWYAHACCSAGSDDTSFFQGLFPVGSALETLLGAIAGLGARVAPLPQRLLGAQRPARAFIGHVEPTFDWTLNQPATRQPLTQPIISALYNNLYHRDPAGLAFRDWYARVGGLYAQHDAAKREFDAGADNVGDLLFFQLAARDTQSTVLLGDPAVVLPLG